MKENNTKNISSRCPKMTVSYVSELLEMSINQLDEYLKRCNINVFHSGNKSFITSSIAQKLFEIKFDKQKIAFHIVKGGTGKTTTIYNVSCAASLFGAKILCIDLDPQGNLTSSFNFDARDSPVFVDVIEKNSTIYNSIIEIEENIDLLPSRIENVALDSKLIGSRFPLHNLFTHHLSEIEDKYDFIFIDCPPTMGHSVTAATLYVDTVLAPVTPEMYSANGLKIIKNEINNLNELYNKNIKYKVLLNMYNSNTILSYKSLQTTIAEEKEIGNALETVIKQTQEIPNLIDIGLSIFSSIKESSLRADYYSLTQELLNINNIKLKKSF